MVIGITGKSGVGKSTYAKKIAREMNAVYVDVDEIGHTLLDKEDIQKQIKEKLGVEVSSTNRKALSNIVFNDESKMAILGEITLDGMLKEIIDIIHTCGENVVLDWILLPQTDLFRLCDRKILIKPEDENKRNQVVMDRDHISLEELQTRDKASIQYNEDDYDLIIIQKYQ